MLLSCPLCLKPHFEGVDSLRNTLVSVATSPLTCPVCNETLMGLDKLTIHLFGHVNDSVAKESVSQSSIQEEVIDKSIDTFCNTTVKDVLQIPKEINPVPPKNNLEVVSCDICSFTFTDQNILEMHQKLLHQTSPDKKTGQYSYHCHLCSKRFRMRGSLMVHLRVAHYGFSNHIELSQNGQVDKKEKPDSPLESPNNMEVDATLSKGQSKSQDSKQWTCDVCSKMFTTKYFLKKHKRLHTGEMPYSCTICNKSFTFQQSYHKHMLYHSSEKPYVCNECGRAFKEHSTLQNHARIHSGERPFGCEICGKRFRQRVSYLVHMRIHTGVMPYKCTACQKSFRYKVSQRSHKCPMNPPGSVVRVTDSDTSITTTYSPSSAPNDGSINKPAEQNENRILTDTDVQNTDNKPIKCIMSVDYDTGNINLIPENAQRVTNLSNNILNYREHPVEDRVQNVSKNTKQNLVKIKEEACLKSDCILNQNDLYSMVMSPILPEVELLCLNSNSPINHNPTSPSSEDNIQVIREKCLEELFN